MPLGNFAEQDNLALESNTDYSSYPSNGDREICSFDTNGLYRMDVASDIFLNTSAIVRMISF